MDTATEKNDLGFNQNLCMYCGNYSQVSVEFQQKQTLKYDKKSQQCERQRVRIHFAYPVSNV